MMKAKFADVVSYFENLASKHADIQHTPQKKHFYRLELDEVLSAMCRSINYPAFVLESYDIRYIDRGSDNVIKQRAISFMLIDHVKDSGNYDKVHETWDKLEEIGEEFLMKIREDKISRKVPAVRSFDLDGCEAIPFSVQENGQHGVRFTVSMGSAVKSETDKTKWL